MPNSKNNNSENQLTPEEYLAKRFGISEEYISKIQLKEINEDIWINSLNDQFDHLEFQTEGIRFLRSTKYGYKPTTYALQILENQLTRSVVKVDKEEFRKLLNRKMIQRKDVKKKGYVAIKHQDRIIGCGLYKDDLVSSRIPKGRSQELKNFIQ